MIADLEIDLIVCDIAPMGIAIAREAGILSILVENFTWDWIYKGYRSYEKQLKRHIVYLEDLFNSADYHIQTEPVCRPCKADLLTSPVSRSVRTPARQIRRQLSIQEETKVVTITMGGIPANYNFLKKLRDQHNVSFIIPGGSQSIEINENVVLLSHQSDFFHPDLINASDAVIGKVGYSTLAEIYHAGVPFGYIARPWFRESEILSDYIEREMSGIAIEEARFQNGAWISDLRELLALSRIRRSGPNGAEQSARFIWKFLTGENKA
jgi:UDP:flavonoid glycosyltransferase YjiC (YdhE family)